MKVVVDASIFTREDGSFGNVSGAVELSYEPHAGDLISFHPTAASGPFPPGFTGMVEVTQRIHSAGGDPHGLLVSLEDITVQTIRDAQRLAEFFQAGFALHVNVYDVRDERDPPPA